MLLPGVGILLLVLVRLDIRKLWLSREIRFLSIATALCLGTVFVLGHGLGMPRDWDLFAFSGVPLVVLAFHVMISSRNRLKS